MMRTETLREYGPPTRIALRPDQLAALLGVDAGLSVAPSREAGVYELAASSRIGVIRLPDLDLFIRPKVAIERVLFLVGYARGIAWRDGLVPMVEVDDLVEVVAHAFVAHVQRAYRMGIPQGYRVTEEALQAIRGRIRMDLLMSRRFGRVPPIDVEHDEFTVDILPNRLIRAAAGSLERMAFRDRSLHGRVRTVLDRLVDVEPTRFPAHAVPPVRYTPMTERLRPAVELARLIVGSSSFDLHAGEAGGRSFLVDMNRVFEEFVVTALRDALAVGPSTLVQGGIGRALHLDADRTVPLKPDLTWWEHGSCRFVGDIKYKRVVDGAAINADHYQLLAYCVATGLPMGMLIYAAGERAPMTRTVVHLGHRLETVTLDLNVEPAVLLAEVRDLAARIRAVARSAAEAGAA